jgi:prepilin peptidase CpaA
MASTYTFAAFVAAYITTAAVVDWRSHKIPNWLTVPAAVLGLAFHAMTPGGIGPLGSLAGFAIGFGLLLLPWLLGGGGMGDVKMLAALGAWLGPLLILAAFGLGALIGTIMALAVVAANVVSSGVISTQKQFVAAGGAAAMRGENRKARRVLPFAVPMAAATWLIVLWMVFRTQG